MHGERNAPKAVSKGKHSSQHVEDTVGEHDFLGCMSRLEEPDSLTFRYYKRIQFRYKSDFVLFLLQAFRAATLDLSHMSHVIYHGDAVAELCQSGDST